MGLRPSWQLPLSFFPCLRELGVWPTRLHTALWAWHKEGVNYSVCPQGDVVGVQLVAPGIPPVVGSWSGASRGPLQGLLGWDAGISGCPTLLPRLVPGGGEWSPEFLNGEGPVRNFMNGESSEEVQAP